MFINKLVEISQEISTENIIEEEFIKFLDIYGVMDKSYVNLIDLFPNHLNSKL